MPEKNLHHSRLEKIHQDATAWALFFIMVFGLWQLTGALLHHQQMNYPDTWSDFFEGLEDFPVLLEFADYSLIVNALFSWLKPLVLVENKRQGLILMQSLY